MQRLKCDDAWSGKGKTRTCLIHVAGLRLMLCTRPLSLTCARPTLAQAEAAAAGVTARKAGALEAAKQEIARLQAERSLLEATAAASKKQAAPPAQQTPPPATAKAAVPAQPAPTPAAAPTIPAAAVDPAELKQALAHFEAENIEAWKLEARESAARDAGQWVSCVALVIRCRIQAGCH
jgi:hypothetical protein